MPEKIKHITVKGSPNARVGVIIKNAADETYNQSTRVFESGTNTTYISIGSNGRSVIPITFPEITSDDTYTVSVKPTAEAVVNSSLIARENYITDKDYITKTITWTTSHATAGYTIAAGLSSSFDGEPFTGKFNPELEGGAYFSLTGNVTKSSALLYVPRQPIGDWLYGDGRDSDFTNHAKPTYTIEAIKPSNGTVRLSGSLGISNGDYVWGENINEKITITISGSLITLSGYTTFPIFEFGQDLHFSEGGHYVNIGDSELTGSGTATIAASTKGYINRFGYDDDTITWVLDSLITTVPNIFGDDSVANAGRSATCAEGGTVTIDCGDGDTDSNASSKTYSRVSGPSKGTVGNNSTAFDNNTFYTGDDKSKITYNNTSGSGTDTFVIRCSDGTTNSANQTVTVTLT